MGGVGRPAGQHRPRPPLDVPPRAAPVPAEHAPDPAAARPRRPGDAARPGGRSGDAEIVRLAGEAGVAGRCAAGGPAGAGGGRPGGRLPEHAAGRRGHHRGGGSEGRRTADARVRDHRHRDA
ncbi:hypothetical protein TH66_15480 [Carbonactinospora thermoautotrophica]|uniref:Uncharacterized protein n=1 Tax=Carbonactinospora thermoautotrophica TaxID=1469144 RepID=A0A132MQY1_9ACTN|nr:hypothetical protein TH66_15480 [Carbonactinospora thermoautotrophica]